KRSPNSHIGTVRWVPWWLSTLPDQNSDFQPPILPKYLHSWTNDACTSLFTPVNETGTTRSLERSPRAGHCSSDTGRTSSKILLMLNSTKNKTSWSGVTLPTACCTTIPCWNCAQLLTSKRLLLNLVLKPPR